MIEERLLMHLLVILHLWIVRSLTEDDFDGDYMLFPW